MIITILLLLINYKAMLKVNKDTKYNYVSPCFVEFDVDFYQRMLMNCSPSVSKTKNNLTITDIG